MLAQAIIARLQAACPALRTVGGALDLAAMLKGGALPAVTPAAMVVPVGLRGGAVQAFTGLHVQAVDETVSVLLIFRNANAGRDGTADLVDETTEAAIAALAGWTPAGEGGEALRLAAGRSLAAPPGSFFYALEFARAHQLRIAPT